MATPADLPPEDALCFPRHGCTGKGEGDLVEFVFPILQVIRDAATIRDAANLSLSRPLIHDQIVSAFHQTLRYAIIALRELAALASDPPSMRIPSEHRTAPEIHFEAMKQLKHQELAPLFFDLGFIYLARLADLLVDGIAPAIFEHDAPTGMTDFRKAVNNESKFSKLRPICKQPEAIQRIFQKGNGDLAWLDLLKGLDSGYRDVAVHGLRQKLVTWGRESKGVEEVSDPPRELRAYLLTQTPQGSTSEGVGEMVTGLRDCYRGFCDFLTQLSLAIGHETSYTTGDVITMIGGRATTYFWPHVAENQPRGDQGN